MSSRAKTRCIQCGQDVGEPPALNRLPDGRPCPSCVERMLEAVPAALPSRAPAPAPMEDEEEGLFVEVELENGGGESPGPRPLGPA